ncbi:type II toxin-antitoxin system VapC family toxin [Cryobacterium fucosi]|uniref:PIN domain-containing protein n=1 Tax=Cryobacterium fucosi TaxID=1259157 RepID=A0A4R9B614_9MICO|nr:type II toxin-antitoxin system VapC family toxin [Cryobacterium fucosi]TFD75045.1 PIN domain-containing protein [Cryobacterium fucosi]
MIAYLDTSAAGKLLADEPESGALRAHLDDLIGRMDTEIVSALLVETELRRMATRVGIPQAAASDVLIRLAMIEMDRNLFREAGTLPGSTLRSLDALHIAAALQAGADEYISYDPRQLQGAEAVGLRVRSPGRSRE